MTATITKPRRHNAPMTELTHAIFVSKLGGWKLRSYSDGGPLDRDRSGKRAAGKRQRRARKASRS